MINPHTEDEAQWYKDAIIYELHLKAFYDSNGDGIGDLHGVIDHLDHLSWLGVNTIWFNPCFASPFRDAGYDVADFQKVAPRYVTRQEHALLREAPSGRQVGQLPARHGLPRGGQFLRRPLDCHRSHRAAGNRLP